METTFTVSNTDVITMLVVEHREKLQEKLQKLRLQRYTTISTMSNEILVKYFKSVEKNKQINELIDALTKVYQILNPKIKFKIEIHKEQVSNSIFDLVARAHDSISRYGSDSKIDEFSSDRVNYIFTLENEEDEERFTFISDSGGDWSFDFPFKFKHKFKIDQDLVKITNEINRINELLRNEQEFKEKLIAQVTKQAVMNLPEIQSLTTNVNLLEY